MEAIKLTAKQALEFIKQLGVAAELVDEEKAQADLDLSEAFSEVDKTRRPVIEPEISSELRRNLTAELAGKFGGDLRAHLRRLSNGILKTSDFKEMNDEEALKKFVDTMFLQKDKSLDDIRSEQQKLLAEFEEEKKKLQEDGEKRYGDLRHKFIERDIESILEDSLAKVPRTGGDIKMQVQMAKAFLRNQYKDVYDENKKQLELRDLTNPEKIALNGNVPVKISDVVTNFAKTIGVYKTDNREVDPNKALGGAEKERHDTTVMGRNTSDVDQATKDIMAQLESASAE